MEETILKSLERAPELLAIVILTVLFIKHLRYTQEAQCEERKEWIKSLNNIIEKHADSEKVSNEGRERLASDIRGNSDATRQMTTALKDAACRYSPKH